MKAFRQYRAVLAFVALALLALSLQHLAHGAEQVTGSTPLHSWLMAIGIDGALVAVELAILHGVSTRWTLGILISACVLSAGFNVLGFIAHAEGTLGQVLAVALGIFVPAAVYGITDTITRSKPRVKRVRAHKAKAKVRHLHAVN